MHMNSRGFSLIELLVVIAIMAALSIAVMSSFSISTSEAELDGAAMDVISLLRKARQNAVTILEHPERPGEYPSYGVYFDTANGDTLILYADCKADDDDSGQVDYVNDIFHFRIAACSGKGKIEETTLKHGATITAIAFDSADPANPATLDDFNVLYMRPEPTAWFSGTSGGPVTNLDAGTAHITISNTDGTQTRTVHINAAGLLTLD